MHAIPIFLLLQQCFGLNNNVIKYIEKHEKKFNSSVFILKGSDDTTTVQYEYTFSNGINGVIRNENYLLNGIVLNVGLLQNIDANFDCGMNKNVGYSWDILQNLQKMLSFKIKIDNTNTADLLICHGKTLNGFPLHSTLKSKYVLIFKYNKLGTTKDIFRLTFVGTLWSIFLFILILLAICLKISTKQYSVIWGKDHPWDWVEITLWTIAIVCQQGLSYTPKGFCSHTIFLVGYLTAYLLYTGFAAGITSILVGKDIRKEVTIKQVQMQKIRLFSIGYLKHDLPDDLRETTHYVETIDKLFEALQNENIIGLAPRILLEYYMEKNVYYRNINLYHIAETDIIFKRNFWVMKNGSIAKILNKSILKMQQTGLLKRLYNKHKPTTPKADYNSDYSTVGREHVESAFLLFSGGAIGSIVFLLAENVYVLCKKCHKG